MSIQAMAIFAITIIITSALSAPFSTKARSVGDINSAPAPRNCSIEEARTYIGDGYKKLDISKVKLMHFDASEVKIINQSHDTPSSHGEVLASNTERKALVSNPTTKDTKVESNENVTGNNVSAAVPSDDFMSELASEIHRLTNIERKRAGISPLRNDDALTAIAKRHSEDMAQNNYFSHTDLYGCTLTCRFDEAGYDGWAWGENLAWRSSSQLPKATELAAYFVDEWMNSDGHRRNILSTNFTHEGFGIARIGNKVYATVNFADPR